MTRLVRRTLMVLFDVEVASHGWDIRLWPIGRLYFRRKHTTSGVDKRAGLYRVCRWEYAVEWWAAR